MTRRSLKISINFAKSMQTARSVLNACCLRATRLRGEILPERKDQLAQCSKPKLRPASLSDCRCGTDLKAKSRWRDSMTEIVSTSGLRFIASELLPSGAGSRSR